MNRHLVLIGLSGAGKSTVGSLLGRRLGWEVLDIDQAIERDQGRSIASLFAEKGEPFFRAEERRRMRDALDGPPAVLVPGAGWAAQPGAIKEAREIGAFLVHLDVSPVTAAARLSGDHGRPLLGAASELEERLEALARTRNPAYAAADITIPTDRTDAGGVVERILQSLPPRSGEARGTGVDQ